MAGNRSQRTKKKSHYYVVDTNTEAIEILAEGEFDMNNREVLGRISEAHYKQIGVPKDGRLKVDTNKHIGCPECKKWYVGKSCKLHPVFWVKNRSGNQEDQSIPYADRTVPPEFFVLTNKNVIAGQGIKATRKIPVGMIFGPYKGELTPNEKCKNPAYSWIVTIKGETYAVDAFDKKKSNWLRYVNSPNERTGGHILSFQYKEEIYYKTTKVIQEGEEVLVWYGDRYGKELQQLQANRQQSEG